MKLVRMVLEVWKRFRKNRRGRIRSLAKGHSDANTRMRAQIVLALVGGKSVRLIAEVLQCSISLIYKVAHRFVEDQEGAFADRREDNAIRVVDEVVQCWVWTMVEQSPRQFGSVDRPGRWS